MDWKENVIRELGIQLKLKVELDSITPVGGGDINDAYRLNTSAGTFFTKINSASRYPGMFEKEAKGLQLLRKTEAIPVPEALNWGEQNDIAFLVLKYIESSAKASGFWEDFGRRLAKLHKTADVQFGLDHDNYIGSLYQSNRRHDRWPDFFREERLEVQLRLARDDGKAGRDTVRMFHKFYNRLDELFPEEPPALLHGDLWGGNYMVNESGRAVIIDPAVYFGHREMDLGMSRLFGGFSAEFYTAYDEHFPLEPGWEKRLDYCNLYPLMVHVNLFGGGYLQSVNSILRKFW